MVLLTPITDKSQQNQTHFFRARQLLSKVPFLDQELTPVSSVKDLGVTLDSYLNFNDHVDTLTSSLVSMLCQISRVSHLFTIPVVKAKLLELRVFFVFFVRVYLQLVVIVYSFLLLYCLLSFWCHHRCVMLRNLSSFLV